MRTYTICFPYSTKEKARQVANMLAAEMPPSTTGDESNMPNGNNGNAEIDCDTVQTQNSMEYSEDGSIKDNNANVKPDKRKKPSLMSKMKGKMGLNHNHGSSGGGGKRHINGTPTFSPNNAAADSNTPSSPERDASTQQSLESMLQNAVHNCRSVDHAGVRSPETLMHNLPQGLDDRCEVIAAQDIHPFQGPYGNCKTHNGIKVFAANRDSGPAFLSKNFNAVERFSVVIQHIAIVYKLNLATVAIYYEPNGNTIAFNQSKALYFNVRFFAALHQHNVDSSCYSYWYLTFAHELAHNLVTAHNKEHGSFTESIAALYLPEFVKMLSQIPGMLL